MESGEEESGINAISQSRFCPNLLSQPILFLAKIQNIMSLFHVVVPLSFLRGYQSCIIVTVFTYSANFAEVLTCSTSYGCRSLGCMALPLASEFSMNCLLVQLRGGAPLNLDFLKADWLVHNRQILLRQ